jgi:hypothetical protein
MAMFWALFGDVRACAQSDAIQPADIGVSTVWISPGVPNTPGRFEFIPATQRRVKVIDIGVEQMVYIDENDETPRYLRGNRVVAVDLAWDSNEARAAMDQVHANDFRAAVPKIQAAIGQTRLQWQKKFLISALVDCLQNLNSTKKAGEIFLQLAANEPPAMLYGSMPLAWTTSDNRPDMARAASEWIVGQGEASQLLGASWLLSGSERAQATQVLDRLSRSAVDASIRDLATAQRWRTQVAADVVDGELGQWQEARDAMLLPLQAGPTRLIAQKLADANRTDAAVAEWLRIAVTNGTRYDAASKAIEQAVSVLDRGDRQVEADRIRQRFDKFLKDPDARP